MRAKSDGLLEAPQILALLSCSNVSLSMLMERGFFPKPITPPGQGRRRVWRESEAKAAATALKRAGLLPLECGWSGRRKMALAMEARP